MENSISGQFRFNPTVSEEWRNAVEMLPANIAITPFVGKCLYFVGVTRHVVDAASRLFESQYNLPALLLVGTVVELLGRCLLGDDEHVKPNKNRLKAGFKKLVEVSFPHKKGNQQTVLTTRDRSYAQKDLAALRNFGAHGFSGTYKPNLQIDRLFIAWMFGAIGETLNVYYHELKTSEETAQNMADAGLSPIIYQDTDSVRRPIHVQKIFEFLNSENSPEPGKFHFEEYWRQGYLEVQLLNQPSK